MLPVGTSRQARQLIVHPGRVQDRLRAAFLRFHPVRATDLPEGELRRLFVGDDLTFDEPSCGEGRLAATLQGLSDEDASAVAARIWRLYFRPSGLGQTKRERLNCSKNNCL